MVESFLNHARYRYLKWGLLLITGSVIAYVLHRPYPVANGGTWLGYTLGVISALIIFLLLFLGIRKRSYRSALGTVKGWLSAHIWLGLSLLVTATLHSGFQLGWSIHSLAYYLMLAVIASGIWGMVMYIQNPRLMTLNRNQQDRQVMLQQLKDLDGEALLLADAIDTDLHYDLSQSLAPVKVPGLRDRLGNRYWSGTAQADRQADRKNNSYLIEQKVAGMIAKAEDAESVDRLRQLLQTLSQRREVSFQLGKDLQIQAHMEIWLLFHVPLSLGLLAALISHIIAVFFYW